jgi:GNAT superfamily N-acetyltransferase
LKHKDVGKTEIRVLQKMKQDPKERSAFEAIETLTDCPPPSQKDLETEWKPSPGYVYGHDKYDVRTMAVYVNGQNAGYLDFLFTMDPEENMAIQFWETVIHPRFQGIGLFSTMINRLKEIARENGVKRLYTYRGNDNLSAIVADFTLGGKILYARDMPREERGRFGIPRRNDLAIVYELQK